MKRLEREQNQNQNIVKELCSDKEPATLNEMWLNSYREFRYKKAVCVRDPELKRTKEGRKHEEANYSPVTYQELDSMATHLGCGLLEIGLKECEAVGVFAENSLRWMICDLAVLGNRAFNVPRGISSTKNELNFILKHSEARFVFVQNQEILNWIKEIRDQSSTLKYIIVLDPDFKELDTDKKVYSFDYLMDIGKKVRNDKKKEFQKRRIDTLSSDIATLMYTSGTSGEPKGTPLTHANIMHNVKILPRILDITTNDKFLSILPIWHILERTGEYTALGVGASIWYTTSMSLIKDFSIAKPTFMISVPRIWILVYNGFQSKLKHSGKVKLFQKFYDHSLKVIHARRYKQNRQYVRIGDEAEKQSASVIDKLFHSLGNMLIYSKVKAKIGKKFRAAISGGGSLPEYIDDFFEIIGITLVEGYGLTETSPVLCARSFDHHIPFTVGRPIPETKIKIMNESGVEIKDSEKGVIWVNGPQVMSGYYKNPVETAKVMVKDSENQIWFNTGDLGRRIKSGDITIIGRIKDTIVLIGGENVEPAPIEKALLSSLYIDQVMVCGQDQEFLTVLIVPSEDMMSAEFKKLNMEFNIERIVEFNKISDLKKIYAGIINENVSMENGFKEIELIHGFAFTKPFTPESGTLTHTLKVKKHKVIERDIELIRKMYPRYNDGGKVKGS